jgi:excisionase family DNA binding protein
MATNSQIKVYTPMQAAKVLQCSLRLVYKNLRNGKIPHAKIGEKYLISEANLVRFIDGSSNEYTNEVN